MQSIGKNLSDLGQMLNKAMIKLIKFNNLFKITSIHNTNTCPCRKKRPKKTHLTRQSMFLGNPMSQIHKLFKTINFNRKMSISMHSWVYKQILRRIRYKHNNSHLCKNYFLKESKQCLINHQFKALARSNLIRAHKYLKFDNKCTVNQCLVPNSK